MSLDLTEVYCQYQRTDSNYRIVGQCVVKHFMTFPIKTVTLVLKVSTYIVGLAAMLVKRFVSTFKTVIILYALVSVTSIFRLWIAYSVQLMYS